MAANASIAPATGASPAADTRATQPAWRRLAVRLLIAAVGCGGMAAVLLSAGALSAHLLRYPLLLMAAAFVVGAVRVEAIGGRVDVSVIPTIAVGYLAGPAGGAIAGLLAGVGVATRSGRPTHRTVFNLGMSPLVGFAAAAMAAPFAGRDTRDVAALALYGLVAGVTFFAVNLGTICLAMWLETAVPPLRLWKERFSWLPLPIVLLGQVGVGLALAYRLAGLYEVAVFALPVVVVQIAWRQYLAQTRRSVEDLRSKNNELVQLAARLQTANDTISATYRETLDALITALDARDNEVQGHSYRVSVFSQEVALALGVKRETPEFEAIARGALLHDVGKIGVRDAVLLKPGKLDPGEWVEMKRHPDVGFGILHDVEFLRPAAELVRAHHERFDGAGYPFGLKGEEIPLGARIFAVADTFDAITTDRPYRAAAPPQAALAEIQRCSGTQFDPAVVEVFERLWPRLWDLRESAARIAA